MNRRGFLARLAGAAVAASLGSVARWAPLVSTAPVRPLDDHDLHVNVIVTILRDDLLPQAFEYLHSQVELGRLIRKHADDHDKALQL